MKLIFALALLVTTPAFSAEILEAVANIDIAPSTISTQLTQDCFISHPSRGYFRKIVKGDTFTIDKHVSAVNKNNVEFLYKVLVRSINGFGGVSLDYFARRVKTTMPWSEVQKVLAEEFGIRGTDTEWPTAVSHAAAVTSNQSKNSYTIRCDLVANTESDLNAFMMILKNANLAPASRF